MSDQTFFDLMVPEIRSTMGLFTNCFLLLAKELERFVNSILREESLLLHNQYRGCMEKDFFDLKDKINLIIGNWIRKGRRSFHIKPLISNMLYGILEDIRNNTLPNEEELRNLYSSIYTIPTLRITLRDIILEITNGEGSLNLNLYNGYHIKSTTLDSDKVITITKNTQTETNDNLCKCNSPRESNIILKFVDVKQDQGCILKMFMGFEKHEYKLIQSERDKLYNYLGLDRKTRVIYLRIKANTIFQAVKLI